MTTQITRINIEPNTLQIQTRSGDIYYLAVINDPEAQMVALAEWAMTMGYNEALRKKS